MFTAFPQLMGVIALCFLLSACFTQDTTTTPTKSTNTDPHLEHQHDTRLSKYVCPMHPQIVRDEEGSCPICGMDLVKKKIDLSQLEGPSVKINGAIQQAMNIRTATVERGRLWKYIKTVGSIAYDEKRLVHVHPRAAGWVETLRIRAEGDKVKRNQVLLDYYAPDILSAQVDFLIARKQAGLSKNRLDNARNRLRLLDLPEYVIKGIEQRNEAQNTVPLLAPQAGIITQLNIREGMYITPSTEIFTIADLSKIWVMVDVFEQQLAWVEVGKDARITVPAYPDKRWDGKVEYIYPDLDPQTRTLKVRLRFDNPDLRLKPNMFANVVIYGGPKNDVLKIPAEALITTGEREAVVKAEGDGSFKPIKVVTGSWHSDEVEILSGVKEGDEIVISGQFLIDSEANIQASFARMSETQ